MSFRLPELQSSYMKQTGMLVVSLRGVNFGFWFCLGCSGQSTNILSCHGLVYGSAKKHRITRRETKSNFLFSVSFRGQNLLKPWPDWSPLGVKFKLSNEHPHLFHIGAPSPEISIVEDCTSGSGKLIFS